MKLTVAIPAPGGTVTMPDPHDQSWIDLGGAPFTDPKTKKYTKMYDPIALMHFWRKTDMIETLVGNAPTNYDYARLLDGDLLYQTTDNTDVYTPDEESINEAKKIREYYELKLAHRTFVQDIPLSGYHRALNTFLNMEVGTFLHSHIGVITTLLRVYDEDTSYDKLMQNYKSFDIHETLEYEIVTEKSTVNNLVLIDKIRLNKMGKRYTLYCFKDDSNNIYTIMCGTNNALLPFINRVTRDPISIRGIVTHVPIYPFSNYLVGKFFDFEIL